MQNPVTARSEDLRSRFGQLLDKYLTPRNVRRLAFATAIGMFLVVVFGMLVTITGSGTGCGPSWPLCRGQFVPSHFATQTAIEYNHRIGTPLETILLLVTAVGAWRLWGRRLEVRVLAIVMVLSLFAQAGLGAAVVLFHEPPELLAIHFGVSLTAFAACLLMAVLLSDMTAWDTLRDRVIPSGMRALIFGNVVFMYVVVYLGAYLDHKNLSLACTDWPTTCGGLWGGFIAGQGIVFAHRFSAAVLTVGILAMLFWTRQYKDSRPDLYRGSHLAFGFIALQVLVGATVVFSRTNVVSELAHGGTAALLFGSLCYMALHALPRPANAWTAPPVAQATVRDVGAAPRRARTSAPAPVGVAAREGRHTSHPVASKGGPKAARSSRSKRHVAPARRGR